MKRYVRGWRLKKNTRTDPDKDIFIEMAKKMSTKEWTHNFEYAREYRDSWEDHHKKTIPYGWVIHHIDFDRHNNSIENLILVPGIFHDYIHELMREYTKGKFNREQIRVIYSGWAIPRNMAITRMLSGEIFPRIIEFTHPSSLAKDKQYRDIAPYPSCLFD